MKLLKNSLYLLIFLFLLPSCSKNAAMDAQATSDGGAAGSLARFAVVGDYLYTVNNSGMKLFKLDNPSVPVFSGDIPMGFGVETIRQRGDSLLFIGSQNGMYIYDIKTPNSPILLSNYTHVVSCDPVVVDAQYAYVTLHTDDGNSRCFRGVNELQVIDIKDLANPHDVARYAMEMPKGLGIDGADLFVCDAGIKVYDASNTPDLVLKKYFPDIQANDVIAYNGTLLVTADNGLFQYSYKNDEITLLSKIQSCTQAQK